MSKGFAYILQIHAQRCNRSLNHRTSVMGTCLQLTHHIYFVYYYFTSQKHENIHPRVMSCRIHSGLPNISKIGGFIQHKAKGNDLRPHVFTFMKHVPQKKPFPICQRSKVICRAKGFQDKLQSEETLEVGKLKRCTSHIALSNGINHKILIFNSRKNVRFFSGVMIVKVECPYLLALDFIVSNGLRPLCVLLNNTYNIHRFAHNTSISHNVHKGLSQKWRLHPQSTFKFLRPVPNFPGFCWALIYTHVTDIRILQVHKGIIKALCLSSVIARSSDFEVWRVYHSRSVVNWCVNSAYLSNQSSMYCIFTFI